jgi:hypothetical protein
MYVSGLVQAIANIQAEDCAGEKRGQRKELLDYDAASDWIGVGMCMLSDSD